MENKKALKMISGGVLLGCVSFTAQAAISPSANLMFWGSDSVSGTTRPAPGTGSWFAFDTGPDFFYTGITAFNGINLGTSQSASGSHSGAPDGTENPDIDVPWIFFGNTGMHQSLSPITVVSDDGNGNVLLDFTGWAMTWNTVPVDNLGQGSWAVDNPNPEGQAVLKCQFDCSTLYNIEVDTREWFTLDYSATVPEGDPSGLGGIRYQLHLESANYVPVPAAVWLFGSGFLLLAGFSRRR